MHAKKTWECEQLAAFVATTLVLANYLHVKEKRPSHEITGNLCCETVLCVRKCMDSNEYPL